LSSGVQGQRQIPSVLHTGEGNLSGVCFLTNACNPLAGSRSLKISSPKLALACTLLIVFPAPHGKVDCSIRLGLAIKTDNARSTARE
jgi:hypothetical protein